MYEVTKKILEILTNKQKKRLLIVAFLMVIGGVMESASVTLILPLISAVIDKDKWQSSKISREICSLFGISSQTDYVKLLIVALVLLFLFKNLFLLFEYYVQYDFVGKSRLALQKRLMYTHLRKPYTFFLSTNSGEIVRAVSSDADQTFALLGKVLEFYTEFIVAGALGFTLIIVSPAMAMGLLAILTIELLIINSVIKPVMRRIGDRFRMESANACNWIIQAVSGIKSIKVSNTEDYFEDCFVEHAAIAANIEKKNMVLSSIPRLFIEAVTVAGALIMMLVLIIHGVELETLIPQLSAFVVAAVRLLPSVNRISSCINLKAYYEGGLYNVVETLNSDQEIESIYSSENDEKKFVFENQISFEDVSFKYPGAESYLFENASFVIKKGQSIGIVGASGAGKTTVVDIILGLLKPDVGMVKVDENNIEENMSGWRHNLAYIPQNIFLIDSTIKENIVFGYKEDEQTEQKVWEAIEKAQLTEYVSSLPKGINTRVGEAGIRMSGGQRQRIGIARALYNDPDVLFFDEATSALDNETEQAIMEAIESLKGEKTMVIIAHRLSTIENCDVIYKVVDGKVIVVGKS